MTPTEIAATLIEFRDVVGILAALVVKPAGCEEIAAIQAKKALPILRALRNGWTSEDPKAAACWFARAQTIGTRFAPGYVSDPSPVEYQPGLKVGAPHPRDASFFVNSISFNRTKAEVVVNFMQRAAATAKPAEKADRLGGLTIPTSSPESDVSRLPREMPAPPTSAPPGELRSKSARADLAARVPPGFGRGGRP